MEPMRLPTGTTMLEPNASIAAPASPLTNANFATVKAMQLNAGQLVSDVQASLVTSSPLDTWVAPTDPQSMIAGFADVVGAGVDSRQRAGEEDHRERDERDAATHRYTRTIVRRLTSAVAAPSAAPSATMPSAKCHGRNEGVTPRRPPSS